MVYLSTEWTSIIIAVAVVLVLLVIFFVGFISFSSVIFFTKEAKKKLEESEGKAEEAGKKGEELVDDVLRDICLMKGGFVYHELKLEDQYGNWTEIDNVYISPYGVFIIETKNVRGKIVGNATDEKWERIFSNGSVRQFSNPIKQANRHVAFFQRVFRDVHSVFPLIVFVNPEELDIPYSDSIITLDQLEKRFDSLKRLYSDSVLERINKIVEPYEKNPPFTHKEYALWQKENFK